MNLFHISDAVLLFLRIMSTEKNQIYNIHFAEMVF